MLTINKIEKVPIKTKEQPATITISPETHKRIKELSKESNISIRRLTETLLNYALDNVELK